MPYDKGKPAPPWVEKMGDAAVKQWKAVWDKVYADTKDEQKAFAIAAAAVKKSGGDGGGDSAKKMSESVHLFVDRFPDTFSGKKARVQAFKTGSWVHPQYGPFEIGPQDLQRMKENFDNTGRALVIDYDHATDNPNASPRDREAAGWIRSLSIEAYRVPAQVVKQLQPDGTWTDSTVPEHDEHVLWAEADMEPEGYDRVKSGKYRLFSPTWHPEFQNKDNGAPQGMTLLRGAITNNPFIDGMHPAVPLSEGAAALMKEFGGSMASPDKKKEEETEPTDNPTEEGQEPSDGTAGAKKDGGASAAGSEESGEGSADTADEEKKESQDGNAGGANGGAAADDNKHSPNMRGGNKAMEVDLGGIKVLTEKAGLPASATAEQVVVHLYHLQDENTALRSQVKTLVEQVGRYKASAQQLKETEAQLEVDAAIRDFRITRAEAPHIKAWFLRDAVACKRYLDTKMPDRLARIQIGVGSGEDMESTTALAEVEARANEMIAHEKAAGRTLLPGAAKMRVLNENPDLAQQYERENVAGKSQRGGDR